VNTTIRIVDQIVNATIVVPVNETIITETNTTTTETELIVPEE
jgi:hypothetical protein